MIELIPSVKTSGEIIYRDKNIFDKKYSVEELRTNVGMVFQNRTHSQNQSMTILLMDLEFMVLQIKRF